ncbi:unnamed protein product [Schistosoma turkestanicum]|nr:unnamed protein product [Schistosoma turkestanicum]
MWKPLLVICDVKTTNKTLNTIVLLLAIFFKTHSSLESGSIQTNNTCIEYRKNLSIYVKNIIYNMSTKTAPVSYCGWCSETVYKLKNVVEKRDAYSADGKACVDLLANTEKGTIDSIDFIFDKWNRSFCSHCLEKGSSDQNHSTPMNSSHNIIWPRHHLQTNSLYNLQAYNENVRTFFHMLDDALSCFMQFINDPNISVLNVLNFPSSSSLNISSMVCRNCSAVYYNLLDYYTNNLLRYNEHEREHQNSILRESSSSRFAVCLDVQNAINRTQWAWYNLFRCRKEEANAFGYFLPLIVVVVFLIMFHGLAHSVCRYPIHLMVYRPTRVEPTVRTQERVLSTSSVPREQISLAQSYGSIGCVENNAIMGTNSIVKKYSRSDSLFDNSTVVMQTARSRI